MIPGSTHWRASAEWTSDARFERHVHPVERHADARAQEPIARHHSRGTLPTMGEPVWSVAVWRDQWGAPRRLSGAALQGGVRDRWIGWDVRPP